MLVYEVVDEFPRVLILKGFLIYSCLVEELLEVWVHILKVKPMVRVPAHMADVLEVGWHPYVFLLEYFLSPLLSPSLLLPAQHSEGLQRSGSTDAVERLLGCWGAL